MPKKYLIEMVCDWRSFSRSWGRKVKESNLTEKMMNSDKIIIHSKTRQDLDEFLNKRKQDK
jgi:hypothetical protein